MVNGWMEKAEGCSIRQWSNSFWMKSSVSSPCCTTGVKSAPQWHGLPLSTLSSSNLPSKAWVLKSDCSQQKRRTEIPFCEKHFLHFAGVVICVGVKAVFPCGRHFACDRHREAVDESCLGEGESPGVARGLYHFRPKGADAVAGFGKNTLIPIGKNRLFS